MYDKTCSYNYKLKHYTVLKFKYKLHVDNGASGLSFTFESGCECFTTIVNDAEVAIQYNIVVMNT